jgi:UDPglucose--hexose-1-phosphate uridylyltransferase
VAHAWRARAEARRAEGFPFFFACVNEGKLAGSSLPHSHSQLVPFRDEPPVPAAEHDGDCRVCEYVERERSEGTRIVSEDSGLVVLCPYAGRVPYECLIAPTEHEADAFASDRLGRALALAAGVLRRLAELRGPAPTNLWLHGTGHWHLELLPRLTVLAGVELGAGHYVNSLGPEQAAAQLRS